MIFFQDCCLKGVVRRAVDKATIEQQTQVVLCVESTLAIKKKKNDENEDDYMLNFRKTLCYVYG